MDNNYFFVDGSALLADIKKARPVVGVPVTSPFDVIPFIDYFTSHRFQEFLEGGYRRFVFYFVQDDERLRSAIQLPDLSKPRPFGDIRIEYCGKRIKQFEQAKEWLDHNNAPDYVRECFYRSEKAVDTQICCDALQLAAADKLDRLFLYTNDYDFVPLCQTLRRMGTNINLFRIRADTINATLAAECDAIQVMSDHDLRSCFRMPQSDIVSPVGQESAG